MKVLILCGGRGTRFEAETDFKPKPMIEIGQRPILWHIMKHYAHFGHSEFILALGYRGDMIRQYFIHYQLLVHDLTLHLGDSASWTVHRGSAACDDWKVTLVDTGLHALKGARIKRVQRHIEEDMKDDVFLMTYGDGLGTVDLKELVAFHKDHGRIATVTGVVPTMRFGEIRSRTDGAVDFREKQAGGAAFVNGGYYVFNRRIFDYLEDDDGCDFEIGPLEKIAEQRELMMYRHTGFWHCMDNIRDMNALNQMWYSGERPWAIWE